MANNEIKTNAEIYREQRKARLAKAAKKKKSGKGSKVLTILFKVFVILLVAALALFFVGKQLIGTFFLPQKVLTAATYNEVELTVAEYNYYYMSLFNRAVSVSQQYDQTYQGYGSSYFDTSVDPAEQDYPGEDAPENVKTWADYFKHTASESGLLMKSLYNMSEEAKADGFAVTEEQQKEIDEQISQAIENLKTRAEEEDFSLDNYISRICGEGLTEESYKELLERDMIAQYYNEWYQEKAKEDISIEEVNTYYNAHKTEIDTATIRFFSVSYAEATEGSTDPVYTKEQAKARADQFVAKVTDEASFIAASKEFAPESMKESYADDSVTLQKNITKTAMTQLSEDFANWIFDAKRVAGNIAAFDVESQQAYCIAYIVSPAAKDTGIASADVRHILVQAETTATGSDGSSEPLSDAQVEENFAKAKTEAEAILAEWKAGKATEETFKALATEKTDDPGSKETGGLYEDITAESQYVPEFLDWSLASHKPGDTGIIKTSYGYHIMYYVGADETQKWESDVRTAIATETYNTWFDGLYNSITEKTERNEVIINYFAERTEKFVSNYVKNSSSTSLTY
ncbi:MAG: peptidylprolyl isomerase [Clostridia bacterium]|nr:peptidylprolyl isomerase [Clostridia bacterium]